MPASPQASSSAAMGMSSPLLSMKALAMKSKEYRPMLAASWMIGQGVSSRSSHSWAAGRITFSAKSWTHFWSWSWSSSRSSEKSDMVHCSVLAPGAPHALVRPVSARWPHAHRSPVGRW